MRPTDENQHGSTRPNLMSASRSGGSEDNILAMLERDAGRGRASQFSSHPRTAWYAGAGALVVAMVGALGWLAWENANKLPELTVETTLVLPNGETNVAAGHDAHARALPVAAPASAAPSSHAVVPRYPAPVGVDAVHPVPAAAAAATAATVQAPYAEVAAARAAGRAVIKNDPVVTQTAGAAIVDTPAAPVGAPVLLAQAAQPSRLPPLVLLPAEEAGPKRTPKAAHATAQPKPAAGTPDQARAAPGSRSGGGKTDAAPRQVAKTNKAASSRPAARPDAAASTRPARKSATAAPGRSPAKAPAHRAPKNVATREKKSSTAATTARPAKPHDAAADGDVALISAIIMHSSRHAAERAKTESAKTCEGAKCPAKPAARQ